MVTEEEIAEIEGRAGTDAIAGSAGVSQDAAQEARQRLPGRLPIKGLLTNRSLWLMSFVQFASNFGWAFLVTLMPKYLTDVFNVTQTKQGWLQSLSLAAGIVGLLVGGWLTDWATRRFGLRYGRAILLVLSRVLVAIAFFGCLTANGPLQAAVFLALVGFATDLGIGAVWAYGQDVGKQHVGAVVGWGNMWGNLGAGLSPVVFGMIEEGFATNPVEGWRIAFIACAILQIVAAVASFWVTADKGIEDD